jgi:hypothetical protein
MIVLQNETFKEVSFIKTFPLKLSKKASFILKDFRLNKKDVWNS